MNAEGFVNTEQGPRLGLDVGEPVVVRRRLFLVNGEPVALVDSYYLSEVAAATALAEPVRIEGNAYRLIKVCR